MRFYRCQSEFKYVAVMREIIKTAKAIGSLHYDKENFKLNALIISPK